MDPIADFTISLHQHFCASKDASSNIFFSPLSISLLLSMTLLGARKETESQILKALHRQTRHDSELHRTFLIFLDALKTNEENSDASRLHIASRIYLQEGFDVNTDYLDQLETYYKSNLEKVDFGSANHEAGKQINDWVEKETDFKIKDLITEDSLGSDSIAVLINAIHFRGDWEQQFRPADTQPAVFHVTETQSIHVSMMRKKGRFVCGRMDEFHFVHLPYEGGDLKMVVILPLEPNQLKEVEESLTPETMMKVTHWEEQNVVDISLPKFTIEDNFELKQTLMALGVVDLFVSGKADLSGMSPSKIHVSSLVHKAFLEVNEEGSEAAAASGKVVRRRSAAHLFDCNHPFLVGVVDSKSESVLFWGRVSRPSEVAWGKEEL